MNCEICDYKKLKALQAERDKLAQTCSEQEKVIQFYKVLIKAKEE